MLRTRRFIASGISAGLLMAPAGCEAGGQWPLQSMVNEARAHDIGMRAIAAAADGTLKEGARASYFDEPTIVGKFLEITRRHGAQIVDLTVGFKNGTDMAAVKRGSVSPTDITSVEWQDQHALAYIQGFGNLVEVKTDTTFFEVDGQWRIDYGTPVGSKPPALVSDLDQLFTD